MIVLYIATEPYVRVYLIKDCKTTTAISVDWHDVRNNITDNTINPNKYTIYSFSVDGKEYTGEYQSNLYSKGEKLTVYYKASNPSVNGKMKVYLIPFVLSCIMIVFSIAALKNYFNKHRIQPNSQQRLKGF
jgi:hypothetical protein